MEFTTSPTWAIGPQPVGISRSAAADFEGWTEG